MKLRANAGPKQAIAAYCEMQFYNISLMLVLTAGYLQFLDVLRIGSLPLIQYVNCRGDASPHGDLAFPYGNSEIPTKRKRHGRRRKNG